MADGKELTHLNEHNEVHMVDIGHKHQTARSATAQSTILLPDHIASQFSDGDLVTKKGPVIHTAILAGIMAVKKTADLIPLCHTILIDQVSFEHRWSNNRLTLQCEVRCTGKTGVEMEALTGASIAALTVYDMCKALSHDIIIEQTKLIHKAGGQRDFDRR